MSLTGRPGRHPDPRGTSDAVRAFMKRRALFPVALLGFSAACSSSTELRPSNEPSSDSGSSVDSASADGSDASVVPAPGTNGGPPTCDSQCCARPVPGSACMAADEGKSCPDSTLCPGGLILPQSITCRSGAWTKTGGDCAPDGGTAGNGCPDAQPTNGAPCTLADGTWCQYARVCPKTCDAGPPPPPPTDGGTGTGVGCATASSVGPAYCRSGKWATTPLPACR